MKKPITQYQELSRKIDALIFAMRNCIKAGKLEMAQMWRGKMISLYETRQALTVEEAERVVPSVRTR